MTDNFRKRNLSVKSIDFLEHGGGSFRLRLRGELVSLPNPRLMHFQDVLMTLHVGSVPETPGDIPLWKHDLVFNRWCAAWDLPDFQNARRLAYLVDNYRAAISHDLIAVGGLDLGDLWRARRWTLLLDVIDRLPAHSWYASSVAMDEEHAKMMADSLAARREAGDAAEDKGPALTTWTPEVAALTTLTDAVNRVQHAVYAAQHGKKAGEPPKALPRPVTPLEKAMKSADYRRRKTAHEALVARMLPHKRKGATPPVPPPEPAPPPKPPGPSPLDVARVLQRKKPVKG